MRKRLLSLATVLAVMVVTLMPAPVMAASGGGVLLKNVKYYYYAEGENKYILDNKTSYIYENGYPVDYNTVMYGQQIQNSNTVKYTFKKGVPKSAKHYNDINRYDEKWTYDSKGRRIKRTFNIKYWGITKDIDIYKYNKQGFVTQFTKKEKYTSPSGKKSVSNESYKYTYKMAKGLPKAMTATYVRKVNDTTETNKYQVTYNSKGFITKMQDLKSDGTPEDYCYTVKYKYSKGKVTQATLSFTSEGKTMPDSKYKFTYTNNKIGKARLANMINSYVAQGMSYGVYNWF